MSQKLNLTAEQIYEKEFHIDVKGYASEEVDVFLDEIIEDYQNYDESIEELSQAVMRYEEKIKELQQEIYTLQNENQSLNEKLASQQTGNYDQVDILKRIARLEQAVFNKED
ncbi:MAG: DivIVA domain-containing protein [Floccifex sp.]